MKRCLTLTALQCTLSQTLRAELSLDGIFIFPYDISTDLVLRLFSGIVVGPLFCTWRRATPSFHSRARSESAFIGESYKVATKLLYAFSGMISLICWMS
jgi:hypothetical protein